MKSLSVVPPAVPEDATGLAELRERKAIVLYGAAGSNLLRASHDLASALVRDQLGKVKRRYELLLDAMQDEELIDVIALALFEAPRGLSPVALQTHELVLHYYRTSGPYLKSLRSSVRAIMQAHQSGRSSDGLFARTQNGNWSLTPEGRLYVDENFRYALQEAAKEKPRRYRVADFTTFVALTGDERPPLYTVHERRTDASGALRTIVLEGPVLDAVARAARDAKRPHVLGLLGAGAEDIERAFGPITHLLAADNRGQGALAPAVTLPEVGNVSITPNLHVIVALDAGAVPDDTLRARFGGIFDFVEVA